jgi:serine/threonine protein kinase
LGVLLYVLATAAMPWDVGNSGRMQTQIIHADYHRLPPSVSRECQELIRGMLRANPEDRMSIGQILAHPWLGVAEFALALFPEDLEEKWRALKTISQSYLAHEVAKQRGGKVADFGIVSPFVTEEEPAPPPECEPPPPPPPPARTISGASSTTGFKQAAVQLAGMKMKIRKNVMRQCVTIPTFS